jgi:hypothetical protein
MFSRTAARLAIVASLSVAAVASVTTSATAQGFRPHSLHDTTCVDTLGLKVQAGPNPQLNNVAVAFRGQDGRPLITYNPLVLKRFHPVTQAFWFYHECAHHALGHSAGNRPMSRERDADCWAVRTMRARGQLTAERLQIIQRDMQPLPGDGKLYLPGPQRAQHLAQCLQTG